MAIPFANKYGTPFPTILNFADKDSVGNTSNQTGNDCIDNASAMLILLGWYGCKCTSLLPYAAVGEYLHLCNRLNDFFEVSPSAILLNLSFATALK